MATKKSVRKTKKRVLKVWSAAEQKLMKAMVKAGTATSQIAKRLKRSEASIRSKAQKWSLSLKKATRNRR